MSNIPALADKLTNLLGLAAAPVVWDPAQHARLDTAASDHANCSVGSYTHGLIPLETAAAQDDTEALVGSGWVSEEDLKATPALDFVPGSITYQPLADAIDPQVVLARLTPAALMRLHSAVPELTLTGKPQCMIVPLAYAGQVAVSPGCAVSRTRTSMPDTDLTCGIPARNLASIVRRLETVVSADKMVSAYVAADVDTNCTAH